MSQPEIHIQRLRQGLAQLREFKAKGVTTHSADFKSWKQRVHQALLELFGPHQYVTRFGNLHFCLPRAQVYSYRGRGPAPDYWGPEDQARFDQDSAIAEQLILDALEEAEPLLTADDRATISDSQSVVANKVFLVHGHDELAKQTAARFLEKIGADVVILHEQPSNGATVIEKLERDGNVGFAVVLLTPDDVGAAKASAANLRDRARQNVILELGFFIGRLGRKNVCALHKGPVELPSDFMGVVFVEMDDRGAWKIELVRELTSGGVAVNAAAII